MTSNETYEEQLQQNADLVITPEDLMEEIAVAAQGHAAATKLFVDHFEFYGKSLSDWSDELAIPVPEKITPDILRNLYVKLANNIQVAQHFYSVSNTVNSTYVGGSDIKKADLVRYLMVEYEKNNKRRPAKDLIERMADSYMKSTVSSRVASRIVKEFWRDRRDVLIEVRKSLEQIGISLHTEMKYLSGDTHEQ